MKKFLKIIFMMSVGVIFLPIGIWLNNQLIANPYTMPPYALVNLVCLVLWINLSFLLKNEKTGTGTIILSMNLVPVIVFILNIYRHFVLKSYEGTLGMYIQLYFTPIMWIKLPSFGILRGKGLLPMCFSAVLTLILCSFIGCKAKNVFADLKDSLG